MDKPILGNDVNTRVSVILCSYNGQKYLREQLDSILSQTYPADEIIIQDDGSTDNTWAIIQEYCAKFEKIKAFQNNAGKGINNNFFSAFNRAKKGNVIAISDQDDIWENKKLEKQVNSIENKLLCCSMSKPFSEDGFPVAYNGRIPNIHPLSLFCCNKIPGHTMMFRQELLDLAPFKSCQVIYDHQIAIIAAISNNISFIKEPLVRNRRHAGASTATIPTRDRISLFKDIHNAFILIKYRSMLFIPLREKAKAILNLINVSSINTKESQQLIKFLSIVIESGIISFIRLTTFCICHRKELAYYEDTKSAKALIKAMYIPIWIGYYYRWILPTEIKNKLN